jgi:hypothetical protein
MLQGRTLEVAAGQRRNSLFVVTALAAAFRPLKRLLRTESDYYERQDL